MLYAGDLLFVTADQRCNRQKIITPVKEMLNAEYRQIAVHS